MSRSQHFNETLRALWPWLPLWLLLALLAIFASGPMPLYSTRTLAVAWEMWNGHHWIVPYLNGAPYSHKVPLLFWMIHAGWFVFGVNDIWPRVLEVLIGAAQLILVMLLAQRLFAERPWIARTTPWALLGLCYGFMFGLQIMYEVLLAVWVLAALLCLTPRHHRSAPRWWWFGLCVGLGLLTKGPVMLLHVVFPWLLGPLWNAWAREHRGRWYAFGLLALLGGCAMLAAWAWPAIHLGGDVYAHKLLVKQTAGRLVDAFIHEQPWYWYVLCVPVLLFPFSLWPRAWVALAALRRPLDDGVRLLLCWILPVLLAFSIISSKQVYYLIPELGGAVMLVAAALVRLREDHPRLASHAWLGTWPVAIAMFVFAGFLLALPALTENRTLVAHWAIDAARVSPYFALVYLVLGVLLLLRGRGELRRVALAGLLGIFAANSLFVLTQWQNYDMLPAARLLGHADAAGRPIADLGQYDGQYHFLGRLQHPIERVQRHDLAWWARQHPDGVVITTPRHLTAADKHYALLVQPFRSDWVVLWDAASLAALRNGQRPPEPARSTQLFPHEYWRYTQTP
ncbi:MAG: glycosyltransferase family 39 protein [Xanthomonadales bacterium]|nr:glycosyltransferase family 39 protein [Xanthomonadales bacterium]